MPVVYPVSDAVAGAGAGTDAGTVLVVLVVSGRNETGLQNW